MAHQELKKRKRSDYGYHLEYRTRWSDNDMYQHMNNSIYAFYFDSIINQYLIEECGRSPQTSEEVGIVVNSACNFFGSVAYPCVIECGMRVNSIGKTSVVYEVGVFEKGHDDVRAVGGFMHVFVDKKKNRPQPNGMSEEVRDGLEKLLAKDATRIAPKL